MRFLLFSPAPVFSPRQCLCSCQVPSWPSPSCVSLRHHGCLRGQRGRLGLQPSTWNLLASDDGKAWSVLDEQKVSAPSVVLPFLPCRNYFPVLFSSTKSDHPSKAFRNFSCRMAKQARDMRNGGQDNDCTTPPPPTAIASTLTMPPRLSIASPTSEARRLAKARFVLLLPNEPELRLPI